MKKIVFLFAVTLSLFSQERIRLNEIQGSSTFVDDEQKLKVCFFPYVTAPLPSFGGSCRWGGHAVDVSAGVLGFDGAYSKIVYFDKDSRGFKGFYTSVGIGGGVTIIDFNPWNPHEKIRPKLILPVRMGYEGRFGFIDLGIQLAYCPGNWLLGPIYPLPEFRGGIGF